MDIVAENLLKIKKHNRRIVDRAYNKSEANKQYVFPKCQILEENDMSDIVSINSKVSEVYDLHHQNQNLEKSVEKERKIMTISSLLKRREKQKSTSKYTKTTLLSQKSQKNSKSRRKYLSLTPRKQSVLENRIQKTPNKHSQIIKQSHSCSKTTLLLSNSTKNGVLHQPNKSKILTKTIKNEQKLNDSRSIISKIKDMASKCLQTVKETYPNKKVQVQFHNKQTNFQQIFGKFSFMTNNHIYSSLEMKKTKEKISICTTNPEKSIEQGCRNSQFQKKNVIVSSFQQ